MAEAEKEKEMKLVKEAEQANGQQRWTVKRETNELVRKKRAAEVCRAESKKLNVLTQGEVWK